MNSIITLKRLVELLSKQANITPERADLFVKAFTSVVRDALIDGEEITIAGVGTFSVAPDSKIKYVPDQALAEAVNAPFAMFQSEELAPGFTTDQLAERIPNPVPHEHKSPAATESHTVETKNEAEAPKTEPVAPVHEEKPEAKAPIPAHAQKAAEEKPATEPKPAEQQPTPAQKPAEQQPVPAQKAEEEPDEEKSAVKPVTLNMERPCPTEGTVHVPPTPAPTPRIQAQPQSQTHTTSPTNTPTQMASNIPDTKPAAPVAPKIEYRANGMGTNSSFDNDSKPHSPAMLIIWGMIVGLLLGFAAGFFLHDPIINAMMPNGEEEVAADSLDTEKPAIEDPLTYDTPAEPKVEGDSLDTATATIVDDNAETEKAENEVKAASEVKEVYDTIRSGNSLGTIAKKHYGNTVYWIYIYLDNEDKITNPNRVASGTALRIPPLSKYATKATEEENKADAQKKVNEVLSKYPQ